MPAIHETANPRLKEAVTPTDLVEVYTPISRRQASPARRRPPSSAPSTGTAGSPPAQCTALTPGG
jgi:hypothetical protein